MSDAPRTTKTPGDDLAWREENLASPHQAADKAKRVQHMFAAIARSYDLNNRIHSMGRDQAWRRAAVELAHVKPTETVLDVACGTGDLTAAFSRARPRKVLGVDFTHEMVRIAGEKARTAKRGSSLAAPMAFLDGDAMRLPLADRSVDVVSIAFGIRNVTDPSVALSEFFRVMRPGGRLVILEFALPRNPVIRGLYNLYFHHILPRTAGWIARDKTGAYKYLPQSVNTFITPGRMNQLIRKAGFQMVRQQPLTLGIAMLYLARRRA